MWYLIVSICTGTFAAGDLNCTSSKILSDHANIVVCEQAMDEESQKTNKGLLFCIERQAVNSELVRKS